MSQITVLSSLLKRHTRADSHFKYNKWKNDCGKCVLLGMDEKRGDKWPWA